MELVHEFDYHAMLKPPLEVGAGPLGTRMFFEVIDGAAQGDRINGRVLGGGGDWLLVGPDGFGRIDVRAQLQTDDGAAIYVQYDGLLEMNDAFQNAVAGGTGTDFAHHYWRSAPRFETGDPRYAWLNRSTFVAQGRVVPGHGVGYSVYRVT